MTEFNWSGNYAYRAAALHRPATIEQAQAIIASAGQIRVLGSRHCFNEIADSAELVSLDALPPDVVVDHERPTVSLAGAVRYGDLAQALVAEGVALHNLASLPHISVAGAVATATHGSGDANGNLATAVAGLEMITSSGEILSAARGDADFEGMVVALGALGAVTRVTLDVQPAYEVRQRVFEGLPWRALLDHFDEIMSSGYSVSVFSLLGERATQVWVKSRVSEAPEHLRGDLFGAQAATVERHPILGIDPTYASPQLGSPGLWSDRLAHFRMGFTPSSGEELQSEFHVARGDAVAAIEAVLGLAGVIAPLLLVSEIRSVAADSLWISPQYRQDTVGIHFTWKRDPPAVAAALARIEPALARFGARPHWGKVFLADATTVAPLYERLPDFADLIRRLDPRGAFTNDWLRERVLGRD